MWIPPEIRDPIVMHASTRKSVACFGAVNLSTGRFVYQMCPVFNGETFEVFVRLVLRHRRRGRRMIVVLDNATYHHSRQLTPLLHKYQGQITFLFLPPYCPQLSMIERVWKLARRLATHNRYFATLPAVLDAVTNCFHQWERPNNVLRRLCCIIQDAVFSSSGHALGPGRRRFVLRRRRFSSGPKSFDVSGRGSQRGSYWICRLAEPVSVGHCWVP